MNGNWLDQVADMGMVVVGTCMLIVHVCLAQESIDARLKAQVCERYAPVCLITSRLRQPMKLFVPAET